MNIAMIHQRTGGKCGVALEMDKWSAVLRAMGHQVYYCTGEGPGHLIPELHLENAQEARISQLAFYSEGAHQAELQQLVSARVADIRPRIEAFLDAKGIDLLIVQNIWAVVSHVATGMALYEIARDRGLPVWVHNHDFFWDFARPLTGCNPYADTLLAEHFPPDLPNVTHFVINSQQQQELKNRRGISATVVPNVFDPDAVRSECTSEEERQFREAVDLRPDDLVVMCGTRILYHKFIEAAIALCRALDTPEIRNYIDGAPLTGGGAFNAGSRIVFVSGGEPESFSGPYMEALHELARTSGVETRWIGSRLSGAAAFDGEDLGRLFEIYCHADIITYTTTSEGWGNQLLEAVAACKPVVLVEYPVYAADIAPLGLQVISMGSPEEIVTGVQGELRVPDAGIIQRTAAQVSEILVNHALRKEYVHTNYRILQEHLSLQTLHTILASQLPAMQPVE